MAATFGARPESITIDSKHPIAQVAFSSLNARPVVFDVTVVPADDVLVVPPIFSVAPYESVLLRVTLRHHDRLKKTERYEIRITEVVPNDAKRTPRVIVVPLSVQP